MTARNLREVRRLIEVPYGLFLVVGPTGSGKTTTLHAALGAINTPDQKIWTAEDPVEITQYGLRQVQVQPRIGFTFAAAMRAFLRADPDVIMVGEMRDAETAHTGIEAKARVAVALHHVALGAQAGVLHRGELGARPPRAEGAPDLGAPEGDD